MGRRSQQGRNVNGILLLNKPVGLTSNQALQRVKRLLDEHNFRCYSEHLSYCTDEGHLYDLMPIPFTGEAVHYVADRIRRAQDILERPIALENVSYYAAPGAEMDEIEFVNAIMEEADCRLLLDVNNIYVNSINHRYDAVEFPEALPGERVMVRLGHRARRHRHAELLSVLEPAAERRLPADLNRQPPPAYRLAGLATLFEWVRRCDRVVSF